ncbi:divalent-cation tolerance protein CutA [Vibrio sp. S11_S32]|uniref:divalent-cation tolerance protein CutA n=1 Tax=Vibrio sp. S11_S32 TaxID=2720225 RepID=UPI001680673A|nr:divalent-cation tolerance protein CutA [Vibrio sp. S11_S32]MBD1576617.1 divalent-cation tolerance protein CutA [Vibrio sp. S11_S32]
MSVITESDIHKSDQGRLQPCAVVLTTTNDDEVRQLLIEQLLEKQLAACVQVLPISSYYQWHGEINQDQESLLIIKMVKTQYKAVEHLILSVNTYQVPQVVMLPIETGYAEYLQWINKHAQPDVL